MDNKQITDKFLHSEGKQRTSGRTDTLSALLPFMIMDEEHDIFLKNIYKIDCKFLLKRIKKEWSNAHIKFSVKGFFNKFTEEEQEWLQDKMDSYHEYIHNYIVLMKLELRKVFTKHNIPEDKQGVLIACLTCNTMAQAALVVWKSNYFRYSSLSRKLVGEDNYSLQRIEKLSMDFMNAYYRTAEKIPLNSYPKAVDAMVNLCRHMVMWLEHDVKENE